MANVMKCESAHHLEDPQNISNYFPFLYVNDSKSSYVLSGFIFFCCLIGLVGNGIVIWFLWSQKKRSSFMFITNLSVADFGVLFTMSMNFLLFLFVKLHGQSHYAIYIVHLGLHIVYVCMYYSSYNFLMTISVDRCVAVFFPIWQRNHRSKSLLAKASALLWVLSCVIGGLSFYFRFCRNNELTITKASIIIYFLMVLSTGALLFKVCCNSHLRRRGKLLIAILISLFFFIITMFPRGYFYGMTKDWELMPAFVLFLKSINSSINPIIYFFMGRLKAGPSMSSLKAVFQKFFKEEEFIVEEGETSTKINSAVLIS